MAATARAPGPPEEGAYLTDGERLAEFIGMDEDGNFLLQDATASLGKPIPPLVVEPDELVEKWMTPALFARRQGSSE